MKQVRCVPAAMLFATAIIAQAPAAQQPERRAKEIWEQLKYQPLSPLRLPDVEEFQLSNGMPGSICFIVMHWSTGQTSAHRLHPTHSSSIMRGT